MELIQLITGDDGNKHTMILGTSARGKSTLLQAEALRLGITYDELLKRLEPTEEQKQKEAAMTKELKRKEDNRLQAVRDAYWSATDVDELEFAAIYDALVKFCGIDEPTNTQAKAVFDLLPSEIIGGGIQWGFSDTEVRDDIYSFVRDNVELIKTAVCST